MILVSFFLGPAVDLASRTVTAHNLETGALVDTETPGASAESCELSLPDNARVRVTLVDVTAAGVTLRPAIYDFCTADPGFSGHLISGGGLLRPVSFDEESSFSSSSSSSLSSLSTSTLSSSSVSTSSSSSQSVSTSSSSQSVSTSSSSHSRSSSSLSTLSSLSSSSTSTSSVSTSSLSSSSSSGP